MALPDTDSADAPKGKVRPSGLSLTEERKILKEARARFKEAVDADSDNRREALDDIKFAWNLDGYQWDVDARRIRKGRPMLTENRLPQFIRQIVNGQRQNRPSISVKPANSQAGPDVAKIIEGMIRHIEQWSKADLAYDNAFEAAVTSSLGYFRVTTEYADDESFDQELCIRPVDNAFSVYDDPDYTLPDGSDRKWCFVTEWVNPDEFESQYGFKPSDVREVGKGDDLKDWFDESKGVQVAEYWRVRVEKDSVRENVGENVQQETAPVARTREVEKKVVEQFLMTGDRIIKKADWAGVYIPIIPVFGEVKNIEGKKYRKSLIRDAKEPQRINNYFLSAEVESVALQPKAPFVGPAGAFETDAQKWKTANVDNHAYLQYDVVEGGAAPQRATPPQFPQALREVRMASIEAMKACMGIYDASLGARSNETSGIAIENRAHQGDQSTYHYIDNMVRAIRYAGTVVIDLLPKVYDAPRVVRILQPDGQASMVAINSIFVDPRSMQAKHYDLSAGRYDVVVKAGPSFQTQREENADALTLLIKAYPPSAQVLGPLLVKNMDFPDSDEAAQELKAVGQPQGLPPEIQRHMQQMQEQLQQAGQQVQALTQQTNEQKLQLMGKDIETQQANIYQGEPLEIVKLRMQLASNERIAAMNNATKTDVATSQAADKFALQGHLQANENVRKVADVAMSMADHAHQNEQAQHQAVLGIATKRMDQTFTAGQSEAARAHEAKQAKQQPKQ
jgi:hypothetical protein